VSVDIELTNQCSSEAPYLSAKASPGRKAWWAERASKILEWTWCQCRHVCMSLMWWKLEGAGYTERLYAFPHMPAVW